MDKDKESVAIKLYRCRETLASIMDGWYRSHYEDEDHAKLFGYTLKNVDKLKNQLTEVDKEIKEFVNKKSNI